MYCSGGETHDPHTALLEQTEQKRQKVKLHIEGCNTLGACQAADNTSLWQTKGKHQDRWQKLLKPTGGFFFFFCFCNQM